MRPWRQDEIGSMSNVYTSSTHCIDDEFRKRKATIFQMQARHVQDTPKLDYGNKWILQFEPHQFYKSP